MQGPSIISSLQFWLFIIIAHICLEGRFNSQKIHHLSDFFWNSYHIRVSKFNNFSFLEIFTNMVILWKRSIIQKIMNVNFRDSHIARIPKIPNCWMKNFLRFKLSFQTDVSDGSTQLLDSACCHFRCCTH